MSGADAAWLHMDRSENRMVIHFVAWFERPLNWKALRRRVEERLVSEYPRFRQLASDPPATLGILLGPEWVDDPNFRIDDHIIHAELPAPKNASALRRYVSRQVPRALDPSRPLWELHLLDGHENGSAILLRLHHAVADGTALMHLLLTMADRRADLGEHQPALTAAPVDPDGGGLLTGVLKGAAGAAGAVRRFGGALVEDPGRLADVVQFARASASSLRRVGLVAQDHRTVLRGELGTRKTVTWSRSIPLDDIKSAGRSTGASVNDVLLAVIAGGLRRYLAKHESMVESMGAVVPFNVRPLDQPLARTLGNKFGLVFPTLPVGSDDPSARIAAVKRSMDEIKVGRQGLVTFGWISTVGQAPTAIENALIDIYAGMGSVIITNVAGPRSKVFVCGVPMAGMLFWVPTSGPIGVGFSIVSYAGEVTIGLMVDAGLVPDATSMVRAVEREAALLAELASQEQPAAVSPG